MHPYTGIRHISLRLPQLFQVESVGVWGILPLATSRPVELKTLKAIWDNRRIFGTIVALLLENSILATRRPASERGINNLLRPAKHILNRQPVFGIRFTARIQKVPRGMKLPGKDVRVTSREPSRQRTRTRALQFHWVAC